MGLVGRKILLTVARFARQKDHASLIRALPDVLILHPSAVLLLVGTGEEQENVEALVAELGLVEHVRFLGHRSDVADIMSLTDIFVLPSLFEGLPLAVLEAMSLGVPIIATRIGGTVEALGENHDFFVEPGEPASLSASINEALADPTRRSISGTAGRERFKHHFKANRMSTETGAIYDRLLPDPLCRTPEEHSMQKTRLAFIGVGGIAQRHLDVLATFDDVEFVGFADPEVVRADQAAMRFGAKSYTNHREMLDAVAPDAVYVCIPPFAHGKPERDLVDRGIPFFVEKPVALDLETAEQIAAAVAEKNLITGVGYHWRYLDIVDEARSLLATNPAQLLSGYWLDSTPPPQWWWKEAGSGGRWSSRRPIFWISYDSWSER